MTTPFVVSASVSAEGVVADRKHHRNNVAIFRVNQYSVSPIRVGAHHLTYSASLLGLEEVQSSAPN